MNKSCVRMAVGFFAFILTSATYWWAMQQAPWLATGIYLLFAALSAACIAAIVEHDRPPEAWPGCQRPGCEFHKNRKGKSDAGAEQKQG